MEMLHIRTEKKFHTLLKITAAERKISMTRLMGEILTKYFSETKEA